MLASIKATYMLRSGRNLADEKPQEESHEGNDNSKKVTKKMQEMGNRVRNLCKMMMRNQTVEAKKEGKEIQKKTIMKQMFRTIKEQQQIQ